MGLGHLSPEANGDRIRDWLTKDEGYTAPVPSMRDWLVTHFLSSSGAAASYGVVLGEPGLGKACRVGERDGARAVSGAVASLWRGMLGPESTHPPGGLLRGRAEETAAAGQHPGAQLPHKHAPQLPYVTAKPLMPGE